MINSRLTFVSALALLALLSPIADAGPIGDSMGISPYRKWKTLITPHFRVNYPQEHSAFALAATEQLETAFETLSQQLYWRPRFRINVNVLDNSDLANGSATPYQRFGISLYPIPPDVTSPISYTDDWIRTLTWHELTHFINMDVTRSFYVPLRVLFGDTLLPNVAWPGWMIEGLAVVNETRFSSMGRGRSPYWEGLLRTGVDERKLGQSLWVTLDRVTNGYPWFPGGETHYFFGYQLMNQVARDPDLKNGVLGTGRTHDRKHPLKNGEDALGLMSWRSGGRIPYFLNGNLKNITGKDWYTYWKEFLSDSEARMAAQISKIDSEGRTLFEPLTHQGYGTALGAEISPDGKWLAYTRRGPDDRSHLELRDLSNGKVTRSVDKINGVSLSFTADSRYLLMSRLEQKRIYNLYSDLFIFDLLKKKTRRLTHGLRAKDPSLSPDGKSVAFTIAENAGNSLVVAPLEWNKNKPRLGRHDVIYASADFSRVATPRFTADGKKILFSILERGKKGEAILSVELGSKKIERLIDDGFRNTYPKPAPNGDIAFVSDRSGVENLYYGSGKSSRRVSNVVGGLTAPSFGSGQVFASLLSTEGWDIARLKIIDDKSFRDQPRLDPSTAPAVDDASQTPVTKLDEKSAQPRRYLSARTLLPRAWAPHLGFVAGKIPFSGFIGASVSGFDSLDFHSYSASLAYQLRYRTVDGTVAYQFRRLGPTLELSYDDSVTNAWVDAYLKNRTATTSIYLPIDLTWSTITPGVSFSAAHIAVNDLNGQALYSSSVYPQADLTLTYSTLNFPALAIAPLWGRRLYTGARFIPYAGNLAIKGTVDYREYLRIHHYNVLQLSLAGSVTSNFTSGTDSVNQNVYLNGRRPAISNGRVRADGGWYGNTLSQLGVRGYTGTRLSTRWAVLPAIDLRYPILRIFSGHSTLPIFAENLFGAMYVEGALAQDPTTSTLMALPSFGIGLKLQTQFFLPLVWGFDFQYGLNQSRGGQPEFIFSIQGLEIPGLGGQSPRSHVSR